ncbi:MAG TPA: site-2 protease family protein [Candidatus Eisenbacteria bacterium]|jgi:Zn-dependent protease/CBS domain-containing protein
MRWSLLIATVAGIPIRIHATFGLLLLWIFGSYMVQGRGLLLAAEGVALILAVFTCVVLHELGHALTARKYGVRTRDITLWPIGGVARLERIPERPSQEVAVAVAGPAVNVAIAGLLALVPGVIAATGDLLSRPGAAQGPFLAELLLINVILVVFNMIPAFPMDGGRVLRALLAMRFDYVRATQIAAGVGQGFALLFALAGLWLMHPLLLFIAFFVFIGAGQEAAAAQWRSAFDGTPVSRAMIRDFRALRAGDPLALAVQMLIEGHQQDFPVVGDLPGARPIGVLMRADLLTALASGRLDQRVEEIARRNCGVAHPREMLDTVFRRMQEGGCPAIPVVGEDGAVVGMLTLENVGEYAMVQSALSRGTVRPRGNQGPPAGRRESAF